MRRQSSLVLQLSFVVLFIAAMGIAMFTFMEVATNVFGRRSGSVIGLIGAFVILVLFSVAESRIWKRHRRRKAESKAGLRGTIALAVTQNLLIFAIAGGFVAIEYLFSDVPRSRLGIVVLAGLALWAVVGGATYLWRSGDGRR